MTPEDVFVHSVTLEEQASVYKVAARYFVEDPYDVECTISLHYHVVYHGLSEHLAREAEAVWLQRMEDQDAEA